MSEEHTHVNKHAHSDEEVGDEQCIADKLQVVH